MVTSIKIKGEEWYLQYNSVKDDIEIYPFIYEIYDKRIYLEDGDYTTDDGNKITIKDKKIIEML